MLTFFVEVIVTVLVHIWTSVGASPGLTYGALTAARLNDTMVVLTPLSAEQNGGCMFSLTVLERAVLFLV